MGKEVKPIYNVVEVRADAENYLLYLVFGNGERKVHDCKRYFEFEVFAALKDPEFFKTAHVAKGTVVWTDDIDLSPITLYERSEPVR